MPVPIKVAYVLFKNRSKKVVPVTSIENYKEVISKKLTKCKVWFFGHKKKNDMLLNAHILLLGCKYTFYYLKR